ncbi:MAG: trehalase family glycosidase [Chitinophagaceae bacterium]
MQARTPTAAATAEQAKEILINNNKGGYTIPSARLYPFQWNWDSGFIALGLMYIDPQKAMEEVRSMFKGQWSNGLLPHINFHHPDSNYFPGPAVWGTDSIAEKPAGIQTSGIVQPPVFGFVLQRMDQYFTQNVAGWEAFIKELFPQITAFHRYLYHHRDPYKEGLVYIHHNWEAGTDNSPAWDSILDNIDVSGMDNIVAQRRDTANVDAAQRPTNENYKRYIYLLNLFKKHGYKDSAIVQECPFLVQDVLFNALLARSNEGLIMLGKKYGLDVQEIVSWNDKTVKAINRKLWNDSTGFYYAYDLKNGRTIPIKTSSGFMPLFAGVSNGQQAARLCSHLSQSFARNSRWKLLPSTAADEPLFNALKYWRGPVWININWMLYHGLLRYGCIPEAEKVKKDSMQLVEQYGPWEYFDPRPVEEGGMAQGLGGDLFSWSAALYLDMLLNDHPF